MRRVSPVGWVKQSVDSVKAAGQAEDWVSEEEFLRNLVSVQ
jgi:hypothetical protein